MDKSDTDRAVYLNLMVDTAMQLLSLVLMMRMQRIESTYSTKLQLALMLWLDLFVARLVDSDNVSVANDILPKQSYPC